MCLTPITKPSAVSCRICNTAAGGWNLKIVGCLCTIAALRIIDKNGIDVLSFHRNNLATYQQVRLINITNLSVGQYGSHPKFMRCNIIRA